MSFIVKPSQESEVATSDSLLDEAPVKDQRSSCEGWDRPEQLKETVVPRKAMSVPLDRAVAGPMDIDTFSGPPERRQTVLFNKASHIILKSTFVMLFFMIWLIIINKPELPVIVTNGISWYKCWQCNLCLSFNIKLRGIDRLINLYSIVMGVWSGTNDLLKSKMNTDFAAQMWKQH